MPFAAGSQDILCINTGVSRRLRALRWKGVADPRAAAPPSLRQGHCPAAPLPRRLASYTADGIPIPDDIPTRSARLNPPAALAVDLWITLRVTYKSTTNPQGHQEQEWTQSGTKTGYLYVLPTRA